MITGTISWWLKMDDEIANTLGLEPMKPSLEGDIVPAQVKAPSLRSVDKSDQADNDFAYARENFYNVIEKGSQALEDMLDVAKASEHPRAYEVVSTIMKTLVDANKDLVSMSEKKAEADKKGDEDTGKSVTNNNLFVGSTSELQQMLKDLRNNDATE
jgi:hypothetical protein